MIVRISSQKALPVLLGLLLLILVGCGRSEAGNSQLSVAENETETEAETIPNRPHLDWRTDTWKCDTLSGTTHDLYITEYISDLSYNTERFDVSPVDFDSLQGRFYELDCCMQWLSAEEQKLAYYLNCYEDGSDESWHQELALPEPEQFGGDLVTACGLDVLGAEEYVLFLAVYAGEEKEVAAYLVAHMGRNGECQTVTDLYPAMRESGLEILPGYAYVNVCADHQGYYLFAESSLSGLKQGEILVMDTSGKSRELLTPEDNEAVSVCAMRDPDGNIIFETPHSEGDPRSLGNKISLWGYGSTGIRQYAQVQLDQGMPRAMSEEGYLYYGTKEGKLYRWDLYTGTREFCLDYFYRGLGSDGCFKLTVGSDGEPLLLDHSGGSARIYRLGTDAEKAGAAIRIVCLGEHFISQFNYISSTAMEYSKSHWDTLVRMDRLSISTSPEWYAERDDYRTQALADLMSGKGADIYCVTAEDMEMLYEKGALMDLSEVLPQEYRDAVFSGALGCGVIDGKQIGLVPEAYVSVVMVDNELWDKDRWTWDEAMAVKEAAPERKHLLLLRRYDFIAGDALNALEYLYFPYLPKTPFLDMENGTCDFDNSRFIHLLEAVKDYSPDDNSPRAILNQKGVAFVEQVGNVRDFADMMWQHGDQYHLVGFPTDEGSGNYWNSEYYVVVNKDTKYWEQIKEYLITLFTRSNQEQTCAPVRKDMIEEYIQDDPWDTGYKDPTYGSALQWRARALAAKTDGSTWDQEYRELLETAEPYRESTTAIKRIILEELDSYYSGDKDAETVAALIQNRVQSYLDEQK